MNIQGVWRAIVVEVHEGQRCTVTIPSLYGQSPVGPMTHVPLSVSRDDRVLVAAVNGELSEMTVLCHAKERPLEPGPGLFTRVTLMDDPVDDHDATTKAYVDAQIAALRAELTG